MRQFFVTVYLRMIIDSVILQGTLVRLEPLHLRHRQALLSIAQASPEAFRYTSTPVTEEQADSYFAKAFYMLKEGTAYPFVLIEQASGDVVGSSRYSDIQWQYRNCELGYTWIAPAKQGSGINVESKYLMLRYIFEEQGFVRVQIHTDMRNTQSQEAIKRLGATCEGVMRRHMINKNGYIRDSMIFAITDLDWPRVKRHLEQRLRKRLPVR